MSYRVPEGWGKDKLSDFLEAATQNVFGTFHNQKKIYSCLQEIDEAFYKVIVDFVNPPEFVPAFFLLRSHAAYLGAARLSLSGQLPEAYMVMRGCIESTLYAFHIYKNPQSVHVWLDRDKSKEQKKIFRSEFNNFGGMQRELTETDDQIGKASAWLYDLAISRGAHPNPGAVFPNLTQSDSEHSVNYDLAYLNVEPNAMSLCLRNNAQSGIISLRTFSLIFRDRFDQVGISEKLPELSRGL